MIRRATLGRAAFAGLANGSRCCNHAFSDRRKRVAYNVAINCFQENIRLTGGAREDPVSFNLYNGLFQLTQQLQRDNLDLVHRMQSLEHEIRTLR